MSTTTIKGYGVPKSFELTVSNVKRQVKEVDSNCGKFVKELKMEQSSGGNIIGQFAGNGLEGGLFEFENVIFVIWSCGEYIDWSLFKKL